MPPYMRGISAIRVKANSKFGFFGILLLLIAQQGCETDRVELDPRALSNPSKCQVHAYLLRGLWDVFSLGLDDLGAKLSAKGINSTVVSGTSWAGVAEDIRAEYAGQSNPPSLVLVGHSFGGDDIVSLSKRLQEYGIPVRLMFMIDGTTPAPIPSNVDECVQIFQPTILGDAFPDAFAGNPVFAEAGNDHTEIRNEIIGFGTVDPRVFLIEHFNIEESETVHQIAIKTIVGVCTEP